MVSIVMRTWREIVTVAEEMYEKATQFAIVLHRSDCIWG